MENTTQRQKERGDLDEPIADFEEVSGPAGPEAVAAKRAKLTDGTGKA